MRHDTLRFPVSFTVSMGPTSVCLCLHGEGVGSLWTQTQCHNVQGERKRTMNFSASSPLSCGEESIQSKSSKEKGGTEYPPTQSAESLPSCKGEGWGLPRLQEETNQEFKKKMAPPSCKNTPGNTEVCSTTGQQPNPGHSPPANQNKFTRCLISAQNCTRGCGHRAGVSPSGST